ncbi:MAG: YbaK/EbsC family protein [Alphaproteobacteria bacterium]
MEVDTNALSNPSVRRVRQALVEAGVGDKVVAVAETTRSAAEAATALGVEQGAIVKSLVFTVGRQAVMALVAGDRQCDTKRLRNVLGLSGKVKRPDADAVRQATGFAIGGVSPVAHATALPVAIDASLGRFQAVYAAAGHPHCVFPTTLAELEQLTGGIVAEL